MSEIVRPEATSLGVLGDELYDRAAARIFVASVVLPGVNYLYREVGGYQNNFFVPENIGNPFEPEVVSGNPSLRVDLYAKVRDVVDPYWTDDCSSHVEIDVYERLTQEEERLGLAPDGDTQLWMDTTYTFTRPHIYSPISIYSGFFIRNQGTFTVKSLTPKQRKVVSDSNREFFKKGADLRRGLTGTRIAEILGLLELAELPKDAADTMLETFREKLAATQAKPR